MEGFVMWHVKMRDVLSDLRLHMPSNYDKLHHFTSQQFRQRVTLRNEPCCHPDCTHASYYNKLWYYVRVLY